VAGQACAAAASADGPWITRRRVLIDEMKESCDVMDVVCES
jgi:hypothetical protein